jgi:hypothetical protein
MNDFIYTKAGTDITLRWRKLYNYIPASELPHIKNKWADFKSKCSKGVDDLMPLVVTPKAEVYQWKRK